MTTQLDIYNLAISEVGTQGSFITALNENSVECQQCNLWYDRIRKNLIRAAPWGFTRFQESLTLLGDLADATSPYPYLYKYEYPSDCLKLRYIVVPPFFGADSSAPDVSSPGTFPWLCADRNARFIISSDLDDDDVQRRAVLSNVQNALGVFNKDITEVACFDEQFIDAVVAALAYRLVMPLTGNIGQREQYRASAEAIITSARATDGNEAHPTNDHTPDWIATRAFGGGYNNGFGPGSGSGGWGQWLSPWDSMSWGM